MENQERWYESLPDSNHIMFSIHNNSMLIGCCGLTHINYKDGHAEVSIYIGNKNWQGKGIASTVIQLLLQYGFMELRLHRIFAVIFEYNKASIKLFVSNKFKFDGKHRDAKFWNGKYHDELVYSILEDKQ
jgi:RimJ/RimL family protein N-acetyltransferase